MIIEYFRPQTLEEALALLSRSEPLTVPLAGGSVVNRPSTQPFAVVDLQALNLNSLQVRGNFLDLGATLTLASLLDHPAVGRWTDFKQAIEREATYNLRQVASVAGTLVAADGRSPFTTALLALDASLTLLPDEASVGLGDWLPVRGETMRGRLISQITIPANAALAYEQVARTPADQPIVCAALAVWPSGRVRLALGGYGAAPVLAFDGAEIIGVDIAAQSAYDAAEDEWASAEYRRHVAAVLARRLAEKISEQSK